MSIPRPIRFKILYRDSFACQYCGRAAPNVILEVEHIKPNVIWADDMDTSNYVTACQDCNKGKNDLIIVFRKMPPIETDDRFRSAKGVSKLWRNLCHRHLNREIEVYHTYNEWWVKSHVNITSARNFMNTALKCVVTKDNDYWSEFIKLCLSDSNTIRGYE